MSAIPMTGGDTRILTEDGRSLAYAHYGDIGGEPVFYFHGCPGSRLEGGLAAAAAARLNIRIIAVDRPGYGLSDIQPGRRLCDWPRDVSALADALALESFRVLGVSGGGPYAAVCARFIPHRVKAAGIVCGLGPIDRPGAFRGMMWPTRLALLLPAIAPALARPFYRCIGEVVRRSPRLVVALIVAFAPGPDRAAFCNRALKEFFNRAVEEAFRKGAAGVFGDLEIYNRPWGFDLREISARILLWHGERDVTVPARVAREMAAAIPGAELTLWPDEGHFSLPIRHMGAILEALIAS